MGKAPWGRIFQYCPLRAFLSLILREQQRALGPVRDGCLSYMGLWAEGFLTDARERDGLWPLSVGPGGGGGALPGSLPPCGAPPCTGQILELSTAPLCSEQALLSDSSVGQDLPLTTPALKSRVPRSPGWSLGCFSAASNSPPSCRAPSQCPAAREGSRSVHRDDYGDTRDLGKPERRGARDEGSDLYPFS